MKCTSQEANKLLMQLKEELDALRTEELNGREFSCSIEEVKEEVRPEYDYESAKEAQVSVEKKIRKIKHAINTFNVTHTVEGFDMTIDEMLLYIPQLAARKQKLYSMKCVPQKRRENIIGAGRSSIIDYRYVNYDINKVKADFDKVSDELVKAQLALDRVNSTEFMEIEI